MTTSDEIYVNCINLAVASAQSERAAGFECNHPSRLTQFDAQLMMVAHDHDVPSAAGRRLQAGRDRFDQIHDRIAHHYPIVFTQVSMSIGRASSHTRLTSC